MVDKLRVLSVYLLFIKAWNVLHLKTIVCHLSHKKCMSNSMYLVHEWNFQLLASVAALWFPLQVTRTDLGATPILVSNNLSHSIFYPVIVSVLYSNSILDLETIVFFNTMKPYFVQDRHNSQQQTTYHPYHWFNQH